MEHTKTNPHTYAVKAYGKTHTFQNRRKLAHYLMDWINNTDGSERDRATRALFALQCADPAADFLYDTDAA